MTTAPNIFNDCKNLFFGMNSLNGANIRASTAIGAYIRIYFVDIALGDSLNRTFINTSSACGAIFTDFVSHFYLLLVKLITLICQMYPKIIN